MFGGGGVVGGSGLVALVTDKATALKGAQDAVGSLGIPPQAWWIAAAGVAALVVLAGAGLGIWYVADRLEARRLADYQTGKNP
jgi:membrane-bound ClpP family serine protease